MGYEIKLPRHIYYGENCTQKGIKALNKIGKRALIIVTNSMIKSGALKLLMEYLKNIGIDNAIFNDVNSEPCDLDVYRCLDTYKENNCDFIIAFGGGSQLDTAKAVGILVNNSGKLEDYLYKEPNYPLPVIVCIPTTSGTGSEVTKSTIINNTKTNVKMLLNSEKYIPYMAIVDPCYTISLPKKITAYTGIDALCHAIESYISRKSNPISDLFALSAIKRIMKYLIIAYNDGNNMIARENMSIASLEAGISFSNSSVTLIHGMSRPIGALFKIPHGLSNAMLLKDCLEYILDSSYDKFANISRELGLTDTSNNKLASEIFLKEIEKLLSNVDIPTLQQYGVDKCSFYKNIEKMAIDAMDSGSPQNTNKNITIKDIESIYKKLWM